MSKTTSTTTTPQHRPATPLGEVTPIIQQEEDSEPKTIAKSFDARSSHLASEVQEPRPGANPIPRHEELRRLMAQRANMPQQ